VNKYFQGITICDTKILKFDDMVYTLLIPSYKPQMTWVPCKWTEHETHYKDDGNQHITPVPVSA